MKDSYLQVAERAIKESLCVQKGEVILVITDEPSYSFGEAFRVAAKNMGHHVLSLIIPLTQTDGAEPLKAVGEAMKNVDVAIAITRNTLTHCVAIKEARSLGVRFLSMPNVNERLFLSPALPVDKGMVQRTIRAAELFTIAKELRVTTELGTDMQMDLGGWNRPAGVDIGVIDKRGLVGNLPAGEALISPLEGTGNGVVAADCSASGGVGLLTEPVNLFFKNGQLVKLTGGSEAEMLNDVFKTSGPGSRNLAEFAIGLNAKAEVIGNILLDEKKLGTAHVGIGNSECIGGKVYSNSHIDAIFYNPTIYLDGEELSVEGRLNLGDKSFENYRTYSDHDLSGNVRVNPEMAVIEDGILYRAWSDAWGKLYHTRVGIPETTQVVSEFYQVLLSSNYDFTFLDHKFGKQITKQLIRLLIHYELVSLS